MASTSPRLSRSFGGRYLRRHAPDHREGFDWRSLAKCRGADSEIFFSPTGESRRARARREESAKEVCTRCPVVSACGEYALRAGEDYGVWGGMTTKERKRIGAEQVGEPRRGQHRVPPDLLQ